MKEFYFSYYDQEHIDGGLELYGTQHIIRKWAVFWPRRSAYNKWVFSYPRCKEYYEVCKKII